MKKTVLFLISLSVMLVCSPLSAQAIQTKWPIDPSQIKAFPGGADQPPVYGIPGGADQPPVFVIPGGADQPPQFGLDNIPIQFEVLKVNFQMAPGGADQPPKKSITELFSSIKKFWVPSIAKNSPEANYIYSNRDFFFIKCGLSEIDQNFIDKILARDSKNSSVKFNGYIRIINNPMGNVSQPMSAILTRVNHKSSK
jgi:hypothetical protein